jgi:hypothetical protein
MTYVVPWRGGGGGGSEDLRDGVEDVGVLCSVGSPWYIGGGGGGGGW